MTDPHEPARAVDVLAGVPTIPCLPLSSDEYEFFATAVAAHAAQPPTGDGWHLFSVLPAPAHPLHYTEAGTKNNVLCVMVWTRRREKSP